MLQRNITRMVRNSLGNVAINTANRIQNRRKRKGKRQMIKVNLATIPRRPGLGQRGVVKPRVAVQSLIPNVTTAVSQLQDKAEQIISGTENVATMQSGTLANVWQVIDVIVLNPAEPGLAPMLAAKSNQFQRFNTRIIKFTYIPTASTATNGTLYFSFYPDPQAETPTTQAGLAATGNMQTWPVYGTPHTWTIPLDNINTMYKNQIVEVKPAANTPTSSSDTTMNASGKLVVACEGMAATTAIGKVLWTYSYQLKLSKLQTGANNLSGTWEDSAPGTLNRLTFGPAELTSGHEELIPTSVDGDYKVRCYHAPHLIWVHTVGDGIQNEPTCAYSQDGTNFTTVNDVEAMMEHNFEIFHKFYVPACSHIRLRYLGADQPLSYKVGAISLRTL